jgi:hypothetical protein
VREKLEPIIGLVGTLTMTPRGELLTSDVAIPEDADPLIENLIDQLNGQATALAVPFPAEAVGRGARWRAASTATLNGIELSQSTVYELESIRESRVELTTTLRQRAGRQTFTDPASERKVELLSSRGTGDGKSEVALDQLVSPDGEAHIQLDQKLRISGDRITQSITTHVFLDNA